MSCWAVEFTWSIGLMEGRLISLRVGELNGTSIAGQQPGTYIPKREERRAKENCSTQSGIGTLLARTTITRNRHCTYDKDASNLESPNTYRSELQSCCVDQSNIQCTRSPAMYRPWLCLHGNCCAAGEPNMPNKTIQRHKGRQGRVASKYSVVPEGE